jgi:hypothetical protein
LEPHNQDNFQRARDSALAYITRRRPNQPRLKFVAAGKQQPPLFSFGVEFFIRLTDRECRKLLAFPRTGIAIRNLLTQVFSMT